MTILKSPPDDETHEEAYERLSAWVDMASDLDITAPTGWTETVYVLGEVMFADEDGPPSSEILEWLCARTQEHAAGVGGRGVLIFRLGLFAADWLAPAMIGKRPPLNRLGFEERVRALERFEASPLGMSLFAVKAFLCMTYFEHPDVADAMGFDGACLKPSMRGAAS